MQTDRIFKQHAPETGAFQFDENVAKVFDDMVARSIPLYADVQRAIPALVQNLDHQPLRIVDLGCSTGTSLIHLARSITDRPLELIGVDNSQAMLDKLHEKVRALEIEQSVETTCADIESFEFENASVVLMNYTLQFLEPEKRQDLLSTIQKRIRPGGFLVLSEKVSHGSPETDSVLIDLYFEFKRRNGYSDLEIARKRDALENVLLPLTVEDNQQLLASAGFDKVELLLKWFNFATFIAYRQ